LVLITIQFFERKKKKIDIEKEKRITLKYAMSKTSSGRPKLNF